MVSEHLLLVQRLSRCLTISVSIACVYVWHADSAVTAENLAKKYGISREDCDGMFHLNYLLRGILLLSTPLDF